MGAGRARRLGRTTSRPHRGRLLVWFRSPGGSARIGAARRCPLPSRTAHPGCQHAARRAVQAAGGADPAALSRSVVGVGRGRAVATHGRREYALPGRVPSLEPDRLVVLRRANGSRASAGPLSSAEAARELVAGTYMAGELRRYWTFAGTLALAT